MSDELLVLSPIVFFAFTIHAVTGFASMLTSLVFGSFFFPLEEIRPPLLLLSVALNLYFVIGCRKDVDWPLLRRRLLPWMCIGVAIGFAVSGHIEGVLLKRIFALFVIAVSIAELRRHFRARELGPPGEVALGWVLGAGVVHGIYATGGPLLAFGLAKAHLDKAALRACFCVVWLVLNSSMSVGLALRGDLTRDGVWLTLQLLPACMVAIALGSWLHDRMDARQFRAGVLIVLLLASVGLVLR